MKTLNQFLNEDQINYIKIISDHLSKIGGLKIKVPNQVLIGKWTEIYKKQIRNQFNFLYKKTILSINVKIDKYDNSISIVFNFVSDKYNGSTHTETITHEYSNGKWKQK